MENLVDCQMNWIT